MGGCLTFRWGGGGTDVELSFSSNNMTPTSCRVSSIPSYGCSVCFTEWETATLPWPCPVMLVTVVKCKVFGEDRLRMVIFLNLLIFLWAIKSRANTKNHANWESRVNVESGTMPQTHDLITHENHTKKHMTWPRIYMHEFSFKFITSSGIAFLWLYFIYPLYKNFTMAWWQYILCI